MMAEGPNLEAVADHLADLASEVKGWSVTHVKEDVLGGYYFDVTLGGASFTVVISEVGA